VDKLSIGAATAAVRGLTPGGGVKNVSAEAETTARYTVEYCREGIRVKTTAKRPKIPDDVNPTKRNFEKEVDGLFNQASASNLCSTSDLSR
jgi:hypothetical protein